MAQPAFAKSRKAPVLPDATSGAGAVWYGAPATHPVHPHDVAKDGRIVGRDPDPAIRVQLFNGAVNVGG